MVIFNPFLKGLTGEAAAADEGAGGGSEEVDPHPCPLEAMFLALEQVLPLFRRRRQATLLKQIRPAVEGMCGRSFTRQHLAQIVFVQPGNYVVVRWQTTPTLLFVARPAVAWRGNTFHSRAVFTEWPFGR